MAVKRKRKRAKAIPRTTGKGGNYRKTKAGAGMTKKESEPIEKRILDLS